MKRNIKVSFLAELTLSVILRISKGNTVQAADILLWIITSRYVNLQSAIILNKKFLCSLKNINLFSLPIFYTVTLPFFNVPIILKDLAGFTFELANCFLLIGWSQKHSAKDNYFKPSPSRPMKWKIRKLLIWRKVAPTSIGIFASLGGHPQSKNTFWRNSMYPSSTSLRIKLLIYWSEMKKKTKNKSIIQKTSFK